MATLFVVATPIGNLQDLSPRAREVLQQATLVLAEDTRMAKKLFSLLGISVDKQFLSSHARSSEKALQKALEACRDHDTIVLVTDAGTPAISDPGALFIDQFRILYEDALVIPIPGPSAIVTALSVSGFPANHFEFLGFIPHKKGRHTLLQKIAAAEHTLIFYESPHRIIRTLETLAEVIGERQIMIGREMTKQFEEYRRGSARAIFKYYEANPEKIRGEFAIVVGPSYRHVESFDIIG